MRHVAATSQFQVGQSQQPQRTRMRNCSRGRSPSPRTRRPGGQFLGDLRGEGQQVLGFRCRGAGRVQSASWASLPPEGVLRNRLKSPRSSTKFSITTMRRRPSRSTTARASPSWRSCSWPEGFWPSPSTTWLTKLRCSRATLYASAPSEGGFSVKVVHILRGRGRRIEAQVAVVDDATEAVRTCVEGLPRTRRPRRRSWPMSPRSSPPGPSTRSTPEAATHRIRRVHRRRSQPGTFGTTTPTRSPMWPASSSSRSRPRIVERARTTERRGVRRFAESSTIPVSAPG